MLAQAAKVNKKQELEIIDFAASSILIQQEFQYSAHQSLIKLF